MDAPNSLLGKSLSGLGVAAVSYTSLKFLRFIYLYTRPSSVERYFYGDSPWALVTGASDGIGFGIAQELATNGLNVILHGRNPEKLERTKIQLEGEFRNVNFSRRSQCLHGYKPAD